MEDLQTSACEAASFVVCCGRKGCHCIGVVSPLSSSCLSSNPLTFALRSGSIIGASSTWDFNRPDVAHPIQHGAIFTYNFLQEDRLLCPLREHIIAIFSAFLAMGTRNSYMLYVARYVAAFARCAVYRDTMLSKSSEFGVQ